MNIRTRRRAALGALATAAAVVAGVLVAAPASAGALSLEPNTALNTATVSITPSGAEAAEVAGGDLTLSRIPGGTGTESGSNDPGSTTVSVNFSDEGTGLGNDGPANAGTYGATYTDTLGRTDSCNACFLVLRSGAVAVTSASPASFSAGGRSNVLVTGNNFERGSTIEVLLADGTVDPNITENVLPRNSADNGDVTDGITTRTTLNRSWTIGAAATTGPRGIRVTNVDGTSASCSACFTVNGAPLTAVSPLGDTNNKAGLTSITFSGAGLSETGVPSLVFVGHNGTGTGGSATKTALSIPGTNVTRNGQTSITADYDLRAAAPGNNAYQPVISNSDGSTNTCACRFDVAQPAPATVTSLDSDTDTAGNQNTIKQGETKTFTVTGTNFSKGVVLNAAGFTNTAVEFVSTTTVRATLQATSATPGAKDVTATTTDAVTGPACTGCLVVEAGPSPTSSATSSSTATATATATGTASPGPGTATNGRYVALDTPTRVLDSRPAPDNKGTSPSKKLGTVPVDLSGVLGGTSAQSVVLNLTVVGADGSGNAVVHAQGAAVPGTSNINFIKNQIQANEVITQINQANKQAAVTVRGSATHVVVDMVGYFTAANVTTAARVVTQTPKRVAGVADQANVPAGGVITVTLGASDIPAGSTSAILNVTVARATAPSGFVVAYPGGTTQPATSNVNFLQGGVQANEAIVRMGTGANANQISFKISRGSARVIVDVIGGMVSNNGAVYTGLTPDRIVDSRPGAANEGTSPGRKSGAVNVTIPSSIPLTASAVVLNVTAVDAEAGNSGFIVAYPKGSTKPGTSNVNWRAGSTQANEVIVNIGADRQVTLEVDGAREGSGTHIVVDLVGYFGTTGAASTATPTSTATGSPTPSATTSASTSPSPSGTQSP